VDGWRERREEFGKLLKSDIGLRARGGA